MPQHEVVEKDRTGSIKRAFRSVRLPPTTYTYSLRESGRLLSIGLLSQARSAATRAGERLARNGLVMRAEMGPIPGKREAAGDVRRGGERHAARDKIYTAAERPRLAGDRRRFFPFWGAPAREWERTGIPCPSSSPLRPSLRRFRSSPCRRRLVSCYVSAVPKRPFRHHLYGDSPRGDRAGGVVHRA